MTGPWLPPGWQITGLALLVGVQRLVELAIARRNERLARARGAVEHGRGHYPLFFLLHGGWLIGWMAEGWHAGRGLAAGWLLAWAGLQGLRAWVIASLGPAWNTRILVIPGADVVRKGPYRWVRHPNYLVVAAEMIVTPMAAGAPWTAAVGFLANAALMAIRIPAENRALASLRSPVAGLMPIVMLGTALLAGCPAPPPKAANLPNRSARIDARLADQTFPHGSVRIVSAAGDELTRVNGHGASGGIFEISWPDEGRTVACILEGSLPDGTVVMLSGLIRSSTDRRIDEVSSVVCEKALSRTGGLGPTRTADLADAAITRLEDGVRRSMTREEAAAATRDAAGYSALFETLLPRDADLASAWQEAGGR